MKKILLSVIVLSILSFADNNQSDTNQTATIEEQQLNEILRQEKKFATEQTFYTEKDYDFKGSEVNEKSVESVPIIEIDDPSLDSQSMLGMEDADDTVK